MCLIPGHRALPADAQCDARAGRIAGAAAVAAYREAATIAVGGTRMRDLTWTFSTTFPALAEPLKPVRSTWSTIENDKFFIQEWTLREHTGTHVDAPCHFIPGGRTAPELRLEELVLPAVVIDVSQRAVEDPTTLVIVDDLIEFENTYGRIPRRSLVMMYSGWETRAGCNDDYVGLAASDGDDVLVGEGAHRFPGFGVEAVDWLLDRRDIASIAVDVVSLDGGPHTDDGTLPVHGRMLGADRYAIENIRNHGTIPPIGAEVFVGLVPWEGGSGGPCRVIARW